MTAKLVIDDGDVRIWLGDVIDGLRAMPDELAQTCVTSPPYWGLRDYGADGQIGLEQTPDEYVARLVDVFREVRRVLRDDGTLWLNLGDSYATESVSTIKPKDLVGIPWRVAFALQSDGWYLLSDIIWSKPNPMPESVTDRPTKAHEYVFLLSKSARYYYDADAIREESETTWNSARQVSGIKNGITQHGGCMRPDVERTGRNARSVWTIAASRSAKAAHGSAG